MASNPPFHVEDQTDEDFFDNLVDDNDDEIKANPPSASNIADCSDSNEAKAIANLSIGEVVPVFEDSGIVDEIEAKAEAVAKDLNKVSVDSHVEEIISTLVSSNSFGFDSLVESSNDVDGSETTLESRISHSTESAGSGVKEVQWSAFGADSRQNGSSGFGSYSDFFNKLENNAIDPVEDAEENFNIESNFVANSEESKGFIAGNAYDYGQYQDTQASVARTEYSTDGQDINSSQYWENLYPGWKYDANSGQWYQVDGYDATGNFAESIGSKSFSELGASGGKSEVSYLQQTASSVVGTLIDSGTTESVSWNPVPQENNEYPAHMVFDPQYPGWYYDTIAQEWRTLETYTSSVQSTVQTHDQLNRNEFASTGDFPQDNNQNPYSEYGQVGNYGSQGIGSQGQNYNHAGSFSHYNQQSVHMWQPETAAKNELPSNHSSKQQFENHYGYATQNAYDSRGTVQSYDIASKGHDEFTAVTGSQGFVPGGNFSQQFNQPVLEQNKQVHASDYYGNQNTLNFSPQPLHTGHQVSYSSNVGRSSAGRPPHALVTFGFGGKLIVMKESSLSTSSYGSQEPVGSPISVLNLMEVVTGSVDASSTGVGACDYFNSLCRQSFPGPLVGGNVSGKDLNKWIDEKIANCESSEMDYRRGDVLRLLLSLLKIAYQHYGKIRSPFGNDTASKEGDVPESAVARLFASAKRIAAQFNESGALAHCLHKLPSEGQMRETAAEVQSLLVSGRKKEALQCAQEGQLWGPALVLAAQLGDQFYGDTVKQMALRQLVAGSPLRTLCLLIAGQPADVFSTETVAYNGIPGAGMSQHPAQVGANGMLDDWEENLAVITANRTKDDELVLIHLGDCLWKERSEIIAAHICYLVAEANFESYSDSARLCLIGADHWKFPRTFASPEAIQRTEIYEYSKMLGNSQFILLPFQPYKLIYAHMLAEVGKVSESLKYCQAVLKSLKTGRAPEVDTWRQLVSSLEERIRTHQQGGYSTNLAPAKLVGKLLNLFDSTAQRVVGGIPPPAPSASQGSVPSNEHYHQPMGPRVSTSQSTMAMSSLMSSASTEPTSEWAAEGNKRTMHNRSVSEPDFGRTPRQDKASGGGSRFGRFSFGSQLLQKTVSLVLKPRQDKQAKLGETNKFYYDEKLKRWVEEGAEPHAEEPALAPPPTAAAFQNGMSDYNLKSALRSEGSPTNGSPKYKSPTPIEHSSGIPPIPPSSNQFSARGRMGVRSRYVDTFNQGGGNSTNLFQSPSVPSIKPTGGANPKFFVPTPVSSGQQNFDPIMESVQETPSIDENPSVSTMNDSFSSPPPPPPSSSQTMQRYPSMDTITKKGMMNNVNGSFSSHSRRTASWSGSFSDSFSPPQRVEPKPLGEVLGIPPSSFLPTGTSPMHLPRNGGSYGDELHEVEL